MTNTFTIDAALGTSYDAIGEMLTRNGKQDASGARRAVANRLASGDFKTAAALLGCSELEACALKARFDH